MHRGIFELDIDRRGSKISFRRILSPKRSTKIPNSHLQGGARGREFGGQLLRLSPEMLKSQITISGMCGGGGGGVDDQLSEVNFKISKSSPELKLPFLGWVGR